MKRRTWAIVVALIGLAAVLRFLCLNTTFRTSDHVELATKILTQPGYAWMVREKYGLLISLVVKLFAASVSALGIPVTEFWWRAPVALLGTAQVLVTLGFLQRLGCRFRAAALGAGLVVVLPVHVHQSRYLWGYEVLGTLFVTVALWALLDFFARPTWARGLWASLACGLYLLSHGYFLPFIPCVAAVGLLFAPAAENGLATRVGTGLRLLVTRVVWLFPLLFFPLYRGGLQHTLNKGGQLGFYLSAHLPEFIRNVGLPLLLLLGLAVGTGLVVPRARSREFLLIAFCGACYMAPLLFGSPPHLTVIRGYMLLGTYFWVLCIPLVVDRLLLRQRWVLALVGIVLLFTLWGTVDSIFGRDQWWNPTRIASGRGTVFPDPGSKAMGYLVRTFVPPSAGILAVHRRLERPNLLYYLGRAEYAFNDQTDDQLVVKFDELGDQVDVVIAGEVQGPAVEADGRFVKRIVIWSEGTPVMWLYARPEIDLPTLEADVRDLDRRFDQEYSWKVAFW